MAPTKKPPSSSSASSPSRNARRPLLKIGKGSPARMTNNGFSYKVELLKSKVDQVKVAKCSHPTRDNTAAYAKPYTDAIETGSHIDLTGDSGIHTVVELRSDDPNYNGKKPTKPGSDWNWKVLVGVGEHTDDPAFGRNLLSNINNFVRQTNLWDRNPRFTLRPASDPTDADGSKPLSAFLSDEDCVYIMKVMYGLTSKAAILQYDDMLADFFGSAEAGRAVINEMDDAEFDMLA